MNSDSNVKPEDKLPPHAPQLVGSAVESVDLLTRWVRFLTNPVDGSSLAVFRIWFAICMLINTWEYTVDVHIDYLKPKFFFSFIPGMQMYPGNGIYLHFAIMAISAACIGFGLWYRAATVVFFLAHTYLFLLEKAYYQNHFYLICLLSLLLIILPANRVWSIDNSEGTMPTWVPRWSVLCLKFQIVIVYFFGGIAKLNSDWMRGQPQTEYLHELANQAIIGPIVSQPWFAHLVTYGGIIVDLSLGFLLFYRPTFWLGAAIALAFHVTNSRLFQIGIFPWLMIGTISLFAPYDWPHRILAKLEILKGKFKASTTSSTTVANIDNAEKSTDTAKSIVLRNSIILIFLHVYFAFQLLIPLRRFLYPGDTSWTELGHRFSWSMMLRTKLIKSFEVIVTDPRNGAKLNVDLTSDMSVKQTHAMMTRPDMIWYFAQYIADREKQKLGVRPIVKVRALESLNLRPIQDFIDPSVDLAAQKDSGIMPPTWIVPLEPRISPTTK